MWDYSNRNTGYGVQHIITSLYITIFFIATYYSLWKGFEVLINIYIFNSNVYFSLWQVRLNSMFLSKPCSLALPPDSPFRAADPQYEGIKRFMLTLLLFYSKQSKAIRGANVVYDRITSQVDALAIYDGKSSSLSAFLFLAYYRVFAFGVCFLFFHSSLLQYYCLLIICKKNMLAVKMSIWMIDLHQFRAIRTWSWIPGVLKCLGFICGCIIVHSELFGRSLLAVSLKN